MSRASVENATSPIRNAAGRLSTKPVAAALAAASRVGSTSVAVIERETSIVSITVASSRGTWSVIDGRARATTRNVIAPRYRAVGTCRRQAGRARHEVREQVHVGEPDHVPGAPALDEDVGAQRERDEEQARQQEGLGEGHGSNPWMRS